MTLLPGWAFWPGLVAGKALGRPAQRPALDRIRPVAPLLRYYSLSRYKVGVPRIFQSLLLFFETSQTRLTRLVYSLFKFLFRVRSSRSTRSTRSGHTPPTHVAHALTRRVQACVVRREYRLSGGSRPARPAVSSNSGLVASSNRVVPCGTTYMQRG